MPPGVLAALSGGIDSAVAAHFLISNGYRVEAVHLDLHADLRGRTGKEAARDTAAHLGIPLHFLDVRAEFERKVVDHFIETYRNGLTPNPCVICNPAIKIRLGLKLADELGLRFLATGHYARIGTRDGALALLQARDPAKDQSYFLHQARPDDLSRLLFPLGDRTKDEVREIGARLGLSQLAEDESQDACFLSGDYRHLLEERGLGAGPPGNVVTRDGRILGTHSGLFGYTIGQRKGIGIADETPYYVLGLDIGADRLVVGKREELFTASCRVREINWLVRPERVCERTVTVKIRSRHSGCPARVLAKPDGKVAVLFERPQPAVTPGQYAVFYDDDRVLAGGIICA